MSKLGRSTKRLLDDIREYKRDTKPSFRKFLTMLRIYLTFPYWFIYYRVKLIVWEEGDDLYKEEARLWRRDHPEAESLDDAQCHKQIEDLKSRRRHEQNLYWKLAMEKEYMASLTASLESQQLLVKNLEKEIEELPPCE